MADLHTNINIEETTYGRKCFELIFSNEGLVKILHEEQNMEPSWRVMTNGKIKIFTQVVGVRTL